MANYKPTVEWSDPTFVPPPAREGERYVRTEPFRPTEWTRTGSVMYSPRSETGITTDRLEEAVKYRYGTEESRGKLRQQAYARPVVSEPALYDEIYKTEEIFTTGLQSNLLKQMLPYNEIPQQDPRWQSAYATAEAQKQSKLIKFAADQDKLMSQINDIQGDPTLTRGMVRDAQNMLINKFNARWIGKTTMPPTPAEIDKAVVTPQERAEALAFKSAKLVRELKSLEKAGAEGSPQYTFLQDQLHETQSQLAKAQGLVFVDIPDRAKIRKGYSKGFTGLVKPEEAIAKYKERNLPVPEELQSYDIGAKKTLTSDIAKTILQEVGGDKNKARELAKQRGYRF